MCNIVSEKAKCPVGKVNRTSIYAEAPVRRVFRKVVMINFVEFTKRTSVPQFLF